MRNRVERFPHGEIRDGRQGAHLGDERRERLALPHRHRTARHGDVRRHQHPVAHRFAMTEAPVLRHGLERVARGVPEVQRPAQARFALVLLDDGGLDPARLGDDGHQRLGVALEEGRQRLRHAVEQRPARDHAVFDDFVEARPEFAPRQRRQQRRVHHDQRGRVKGADQVLALGMIDAHLSPDGAVHLRQQRGGDLDDRDAAKIGGGGKSRGITEHASADRHDRARAIRVRADQGVVNAADGLQVLVPFAVGDQDWLFGGQPGERLFVKAPDSRVRDEEAAPGHACAVEQPADPRGRPWFDMNGVTAAAAADVENHG